MADSVAAITGCGEQQAAALLEAAAGNVELAISLFFDQMQGDAVPPQPVATAAANAAPSEGWAGGDGNANGRAPWEASLWPRGGGLGVVPEAWREQGLELSANPAESLGLIQHKNGPCGVLAVIQAVVIAQALEAGEVVCTSSDQVAPPPWTPDDAALVRAVSAIMWNCRAGHTGDVQLCVPVGEGGAVDFVSVGAVEELTERVLADLPRYKMAGGLNLFLYTLVQTFGADALAAAMGGPGGEQSLVYGRFNLCSSELMTLMISGLPSGNFSAFSATGSPNDLESPFGIGLLSLDELTTGVPICDGLKSPRLPVWILHGGDHFTTLFAPTSKSSAADSPLTLYHWNGLPPGRGLRRLVLNHEGVADPAPPQAKPSFFKPLPGEIEDVVQAAQEDRDTNPNDWRLWRYECVLAVDDPTVQGAERPAGAAPPPTFPQGEPLPGPWRCRACYATRFKTMCFGQNDGGSGAAGSRCRHCDKPRKECGWSIFMAYADLPSSWQRAMDRRHAPKIITLLRTKWPGANVEIHGGKASV